MPTIPTVVYIDGTPATDAALNADLVALESMNGDRTRADAAFTEITRDMVRPGTLTRSMTAGATDGIDLTMGVAGSLVPTTLQTGVWYPVPGATVTGAVPPGAWRGKMYWSVPYNVELASVGFDAIRFKAFAQLTAAGPMTAIPGTRFVAPDDDPLPYVGSCMFDLPASVATQHLSFGVQVWPEAEGVVRLGTRSLIVVLTKI